MSKKIIITCQLLLILFIQAFSQSDTTLCIDFNPDLNHKIRKNIIGIHASLGVTDLFPFELSYERILKENKTIKASFGGFPFFVINKSFHCNIAYRSYFSNMKYSKTTYKSNTYFIRNQQRTMSAPRGLYVETMGFFNMQDYHFIYSSNNRNLNIGLGVGLGYQFLFFNRLALNSSVQVPLTFDRRLYYRSDNDGQRVYYEIFNYLKPGVLLNLNLGFAF